MRIKFVTNWRHWRAGEEIEVGAGPGLEFVRRGKAERVDQRAQVDTTKREKRTRKAKA